MLIDLDYYTFLIQFNSYHALEICRTSGWRSEFQKYGGHDSRVILPQKMFDKTIKTETKILNNSDYFFPSLKL